MAKSCYGLFGGIGLLALVGPTGCGGAELVSTAGAPQSNPVAASRPNQPPHVATPNTDIEINPRLVYVDQMPGEKTVGVFDDHLVFPVSGNDWLLSKGEGDVLLCYQACGTRGFLNKVVSVRRDGDRIVVQTLPGTLTDVVFSGHLHYVFDLRDLERRPGDPQQHLTEGVSKTVSKSVHWSDKYADASLTLSGTVGVSLTVDVDITHASHRVCCPWGLCGCVTVPLPWPELKSASLIAKGYASASADMSLDAKASWSKTWTGPTETVQLAEFDVQAGWVPLVFFVDLSETPSATVSADAKITVNPSLTVSETVEIGAEYTQKGGWEPVRHNQATVTHTSPQPVGEAHAEIEGQLDLQLSVALYKTIGPTFDLTPDIGALVDFVHDCTKNPPDVLSWNGFWGFDCKLGGKVDVLGDTLFDESWTIFTDGPHAVFPGQWTVANDPLCSGGGGGINCTKTSDCSNDCAVCIVPDKQCPAESGSTGSCVAENNAALGIACSSDADCNPSGSASACPDITRFQCLACSNLGLSCSGNCCQ